MFVGLSVCLAPRKYLQNNLFARIQMCLLSGSFMHANGRWKTRQTSSFKDLKECLIHANVFSVLAVRIESKMIIFTSELLQGFRLFFQVNFAYDYAFVWKMAVLRWKFNRH